MSDGSTTAFAEAVRESVRRQAKAAIERRAFSEASLLECPRCGDRIVSLDEPLTFARTGTGWICRPCRAQTELHELDHTIDLGGEG